MVVKLHSRTKESDFVTKQYEFASHIRNPDKHPCPTDVETRRMAVYRELFVNNIEDFMAASFPVLYKILGEERWNKIVLDYFYRHHAETPLFPELPGEFLKYLQYNRQAQDNDPPFLLELAHYEWMELAAAQDDNEIDMDAIDPNGDLLEGRPALSPLVWVLSYSYPVHRISLEFQPGTPEDQPTWLIVYRDCTDEVSFIEINAVTAKLLQRLQHDNETTGRTILQNIASEIRHPAPDTVIKGGRDILIDLLTRDIILGTRKA